MLRIGRGLFAVLILTAFMTLGIGFDTLVGGSTVYGAVGNIEEGGDVQYIKTHGVLNSLGFDTTKMPSTYNPDATTNPYGSNVSTVNEVREMVLLRTKDKDSGHQSDGKYDVRSSYLFGHNKKLDGQYETFKNGESTTQLNSLLGELAFVSAVKCDVNGDGRDSQLAIVYTNYHYDKENPLGENSEDRNINLCIYDPKSGIISSPITISKITGDSRKYNFLIQSQLQVAAGDFDKDDIDEIAVYSPAVGESDNSKVTIYDLVEGKDCKNPFANSAWRSVWNYILPVTSEEVVHYNDVSLTDDRYIKNIYNNVDVTAGDADNDGICDLVVSYGASDTDYFHNINAGSNTHKTKALEQKIVRSTPSKSVLLYGDDRGQMLKDSQNLSYEGNELIRTSFAFGDLDGDGNEEMLLGGQLRAEAEDNTSRVLGKYAYDSDSRKMELEHIDNMKVVDGKWDDDKKTFTTSNGWDGYYNSAPLMKTNLAVGNIYGKDDSTKIYMDSVLYSYDGGRFEIVDELEDTTKEDDENGKPKNKGSYVFNILGYYGDGNRPAVYYEHGADAGNFTGGITDNFVINTMTIPRSFNKSGTGDLEKHANAANTVVLKKAAGNEKKVIGDTKGSAEDVSGVFKGGAVYAVMADTDEDSLVATYTGVHEITYQSPKVLAVLASPPYHKDVAAYDGGDMLNYCGTSYGESSGLSTGKTYSFSDTVGAFVNIELGYKYLHGIINATEGRARSATWGHSNTREFSISYETVGGEDAVVLYSIPTENYIYELEGVSVNDDGSYDEVKQLLALSDQHKPVTQTLQLEDYMEIQKKNAEDLPDVTKYLTSTPGEPETYPRNENDISKEAKNKLKKIDTGDKFAGIAFGGGSVTQSITYSHSEEDREKNTLEGVAGSLELGLGTTIGTEWWYAQASGGFSYEFTNIAGKTESKLSGVDCSGTVVNMPRAAKGYGYDFSWKLFKYDIKDDSGGVDSVFPVISYIVDDVKSPPHLPENIAQDFERTTDSQICLTWTYNRGNPLEFDIYRYEDFPQGGGDKLVGTVKGSDYRIKKDDDGNTIRDKDGNPIKEYSFIETGLTADAKYQYRLKVKRATNPKESIFSPIVEARTDVGTKPNISLSTDELRIYPDSTYEVSVMLADPENYQSDINYQWQKYDKTKRQWIDVEDAHRQKLQFFNCSSADAGEYRCRVNLVRKVEGHPQYISAFTDKCKVIFSLRDVKFGDIAVFDGEGISNVNTGLSVAVYNASETSLEKPTGRVTFTVTGPNGTMTYGNDIDEATGVAKINSLEDIIGTMGQKNFVDGGYVITARYEGSNIFYPADSPEEYHYLRNIDECIFLSARSSYEFGEDICPSTELADYKKDKLGNVKKEDLTDRLSTIKFYEVDRNNHKKGEAVATCNLSETDGKARVPLDPKLAGKAYVEAYMTGSEEPVASTVIKTTKIDLDLKVKEKMTGSGELLNFISTDDVEFTEGVDPKEKNIKAGNEYKSLEDYLLIKYYDQNGTFKCDSESQNSNDFVPATYNAEVTLSKGAEPVTENEDEYIPNTHKDVSTFYNVTYKGNRFLVVGSYYLVSAGAKDPNTGSVAMVQPDQATDFIDRGYAGGTKLTLKAMPDKGYEVKSWIVDECGVNVYTLGASEKIDYVVRSRDTDGTGDKKGKILIRAVMAPKDNKLVYGNKGEGTVSVVPDVESGTTVLADTKLTFKATPADGWRFVEWRIANEGGSNTVSQGTAAEDGTNTKGFTMPDNSVEVNAVFERETINIETSNDFDVSYINDGSNPNYDSGEEVLTEKGRNVPKGVKVRVKTKPGISLKSGSTWEVTIYSKSGGAEPVSVDVKEINVQGREGCEFTLPKDVTSCSVAAETMAERHTVTALSDDTGFTIKVDGIQKASGTVGKEVTVSDIENGAQVDITGKPQRGRMIDKWIVNGEEKTSDDNAYQANITENMNVTVSTKGDDEVTLKMSAEGGGIGKYVITDKNGDEVEGTFESGTGEPKKVTAYKGESLRIGVADSDTSHTLNAVFVDGVQQKMEDGEFLLEEIDDNAEIVCRFGSNTYRSVTFKKDWKTDEPMILDEDGAEIKDGGKEIISDGTDLTFSVILDRHLKCLVAEEDASEYMQPIGEPVAYGDNKYRYTYKIENVSKDKKIIVSDYRIIYIYNEDDFYAYIREVHGNAGSKTLQPDAVLMNDITLSEDKSREKLNGAQITNNYSVFNGNGHKISGVKIGSETDRVSGFKGLFGNLEEGATVKDLWIDDIQVFTKAAMGNQQAALLTGENRGTISNVAVTTAVFNTSDEGSGGWNQNVAALATDNHGTIKGCMVSGFKIETTAIRANAGAAGALINRGVMEGNYFDDFTIKAQGEAHASSATDKIVVFNDQITDLGTFKNNYYEALYDIDDSHGEGTADPYGISVYSLTEQPLNKDKAEEEVRDLGFPCKVAYIMNGKADKAIWSIPIDRYGKPKILQKALAGDKYKVPVKVVFAATEENVKTAYIVPGKMILPGQDVFGEDEPYAWMIGDVAYTPGTVVTITEDTVVTGISDADGFVAMRTEYLTDTIVSEKNFYKDPDVAAKAVMDKAEGENPPHRQELDIIGDCELTIGFEIDAKTVMTVKGGKTLTLKGSSAIVNKGKMVVEDEANTTVHKYGTITNENLVEIPKECTFYNYGTRFSDKKDSAKVEERVNITCKPHIHGEWKYADKPETEGENAGKWKKTSICEVCTKEVEEYMDPNPPISIVKNIEILQEPNKTVYEVGDEFTDEGLIVIANLTDGTRAMITNGAGGYELALRIGDEETAIKNGDELHKRGSAKVIVKYDKFTADFGAEILDTADLLSVTNDSGTDVTRETWNKNIEVQPGEKINLYAALKDKVPYKTRFKWETDDETIADIDAVSGSSNTVTAGRSGNSVITVTVVDEQGNPVTEINPKHVDINVISHIKSLSIIGGDISINKGQSHEVVLDVAPEDTTDKVEWTTADKGIAVVDPQGFVTGIKGGTTTVTAKSPGGLADSRKVYVRENPKSLELDPGNLEIRKEGFAVISARALAESSNGEIEWTMEETASGENVAGFYVKNETTGEMEVVDSVKTGLSGDGAGYSDTYVVIAGVRSGTAVVKAKTKADGDAEGAVDGMLEKTCSVTVTDTPGVFVNITHNGAIASGKTFTLDVEGKYIQLGATSSEENDTFTWSTMDDEKNPVVKVDQTGKATLRRTGVAVVRVKSNITEAIDVCMLNVVIRPKSIELSDAEKTMKKGEEHTLTATLKPEGSVGKINWSSSDEKVATVSDEGRIKAVSKGSCIITAAVYDDGVGPATCNVTVTEEVNPTPPTPPTPPQPNVKVSKPLPKVIAKGKTAMVLTWSKVKDAEGYDVFFAKCSKNCKKTKFKRIKTIKSIKKLKVVVKKLKPRKAYKFYVKAWVKKNGKKKYIAKSPSVHGYTANGNKKYTNVKALRVNKAKVTLRKGKTFKIKTKIVKYHKKKKLMPKTHTPWLRYMSSNEAVAKVSSKGKIQAKSKGTCKIYVFAANGVSKAVKVTIK